MEGRGGSGVTGEDWLVVGLPLEYNEGSRRKEGERERGMRERRAKRG